MPISLGDEQASAHLAESSYQIGEIEYFVPALLDQFTAHLTPIFDRWRKDLGVNAMVKQRELVPTENDGEEFEFMAMESELQMKEIRFSDVSPRAQNVLSAFADAFGTESRPKEYEPIASELDEVRTEIDAVECANRYGEIERYILENALVLPLLNADAFREFEVQPWVSGLTFRQFPGSVFYGVVFNESAPKRDWSIAK